MWYGMTMEKGFCVQKGEGVAGVKVKESAVMNDLSKGNNNVSDIVGDSPIATRSLEHKLGSSHVLGALPKDDGEKGKLNKDGADSRIHNNSGLTFSGPTPYAKLVTGEPSGKNVNFRTLITSSRNEDDVPYPVVANYVRSTWGKYGLVKCDNRGLSRLCEAQTDLASQEGQSCMETCGTAEYDPSQMIVIVGRRAFRFASFVKSKGGLDLCSLIIFMGESLRFSRFVMFLLSFVGACSSPTDILVLKFLSRMRELVMKYKAEKVCHEEMVKMPLVDLKDGSFRICMDYRKLIEIAIRNCCHQIRVHKEEIPKTDFKMRYGHFEFMVMPFGLTKAPVVFIELMSQEEHESHLKMNLELLKKEKCYVKPNKVEAEKGGVKSRRVRDICRTNQAEISEKMRSKDFDCGGGVCDEVFYSSWTEIGESKMIGLEMEQETTKVVMVKERLKEAKDRQERVKLIEIKILEFSVGDHD
nr:putative reverse transcriptase domain-containing protein [Tanacetum cinerariifolium]